MKILILNGTSRDTDSALQRFVPELAEALTANHAVTVMTLNELTISRCTGCFGCWVKTPGRCVAADDSAQICEAYIQSDRVVYASPIIRGFTSALLKKAQDKLIPLLHPYFKRVAGEVHHMPRYGAYPEICLLLETAADTDDEDVEIVKEIYHRNARNFQTRLSGCAFTHMDVVEAARVIAAD